MRPIGEPWPTLTAGETVVVEDDQGWRWRGTIEAIRDDDTFTMRIEGEREALPLPTIVDGQITLPNVSGHAHLRSWRQGDIVAVGDLHYRVARKPKPIASCGSLVYQLTPATPEQFATRPGRVKMGGEQEARRAIGSCVQTPTGEWLHAEKVERRAYGSAEGEYFGTLWYVAGRHVAPAKAAKLNELHGPTLAADLAKVAGERVSVSMPSDAAVLIPRNGSSLAATGERVAIVDGAILHERVGDPDMSDLWRHYVVRIDADAALRRRVAAYIKVRKAVTAKTEGP